MNDHYHLLLKLKSGRQLPQLLGRLHGSTSRSINLQAAATGRQVWHNYWDTCIRTEFDLWAHFNYIHHNPVKHRYVSSMEEWLFSSYGYYLRAKGHEWLSDCWHRYPVVDHIGFADV